MRVIIVLLVGLIGLAGGAGAAYFYFFQSAEASVSEEHAEVEEDKEEKNLHAEFVELDPLILPIVDDEGVSQVVSLVIALEVHDSAGKEKVSFLEPRLKDAFIQDMYGVLNRHAALKGGVIQVSSIKKRLNHISAEVLGEDVVSDVLLQVVQQRPM